MTNRQEVNNDNRNNTEDAPDSENLHRFWAGIWEQPVQHNSDAPWIKTGIDGMGQHAVVLEILARKIYDQEKPQINNISTNKILIS
ncbi:unnamed protein product [Euphydryas editha]|uniref:Uncharacterized protein n=1 Tax=Euphydryas editha TaxID=104508 RepID=A0AAU9UPD1_EUPED|nr:unnamed protein product [Euphydryas editha]